MTAPVLEIDGVAARRGHGRTAVTALTPTSLTVAAGESVAVVGRSGAGKSTLGEVVLGMLAPTAGEVRVRGRPWCDPRRRPVRRDRHLVQGVPQDATVAFVPRWTLGDSVARAVRGLTGVSDPGAVDRAVREAARAARLDPDLLARRPGEVSGGQAQRAAIARALAVRPAVLVADEPTSALDATTGDAVATALLDLVASRGIALLLITHDPRLAHRCTRTLRLTAPEGHRP